MEGSLCIRSPRDLPEGLDLGPGLRGRGVSCRRLPFSHCLTALCLREISFTKLASAFLPAPACVCVCVSFLFRLLFVVRVQKGNKINKMSRAPCARKDCAKSLPPPLCPGFPLHSSPLRSSRFVSIRLLSFWSGDVLVTLVSERLSVAATLARSQPKD